MGAATDLAIDDERDEDILLVRFDHDLVQRLPRNHDLRHGTMLNCDATYVVCCGHDLAQAMGWDGMGWDGMGWDGMGWDGMRASDCAD